MLDYLTLPTEEVPASSIAVGDVLIHHGRTGERPVRVLRVKRLGYRPATPTAPDRIVLLVRPVGKAIHLGFTALRPVELAATFTRVVE